MSAQLPNVGRPKGGSWRHLQDEGIVWEGQVLVTGDDIDLAALLIVTSARLAFVRGGDIVLDIERDWLDPAPVLRRTGTVQLWISPPGEPVAESLTFIARDGRDEAAVLLSLISESSFGSAYRIPSYAPEHAPPAPEYPIAPSRRRSEWDAYGYSRDPQPLQVFSLLDDDDFPPVETSAGSMPPWEEAIAEALEPSSLMPLAGSIRQPNDPIRPIDGFDSKYTRDRRNWVIRLVGLFALFAIGSIIASGVLPGVEDLRGLFAGDTPTPITVAQNETAAETPISITTEQTTAAPTATATKSGPSTSDPRDPTVVPIETGVVLGVGGESTDTPPLPTSTTAPTEEPAVSGNETVAASVSEPSAAPAETTTAIIPAPDENFTPAATATTAQTPTETAASATAESSAPAVAATGDLRVDIKQVHRGERLPDLTLGRNSVGEWVVVLVDITNESTEPVELPMSAIQLVPNGDPAAAVSLDSASSAVASYLGMTPTVRSDESATIPAGGVQQLALVFSVPASTGDVTVQIGDDAFDLASGAPAETADAQSVVQSLSVSFNPPTSDEIASSSRAAESMLAGRNIGIRFAGWLAGEAFVEPMVDPTAEAADVVAW